MLQQCFQNSAVHSNNRENLQACCMHNLQGEDLLAPKGMYRRHNMGVTSEPLLLVLSTVLNDNHVCVQHLMIAAAQPLN